MSNNQPGSSFEALIAGQNFSDLQALGAAFEQPEQFEEPSLMNLINDPEQRLAEAKILGDYKDDRKSSMFTLETKPLETGAGPEDNIDYTFSEIDPDENVWLLHIGNGPPCEVVLHGASTPDGEFTDADLIKKDVGLKFSVIQQGRTIAQEEGIIMPWYDVPESLPPDVQSSYMKRGYIRQGNDGQLLWRIPVKTYVTGEVQHLEWHEGEPIDDLFLPNDLTPDGGYPEVSDPRVLQLQ